MEAGELTAASAMAELVFRGGKNVTTPVWWRRMVEEIAEPSVRGGNSGGLGVQ